MDKKLSELGEHDFDELLDTGVFAPASQTVSSLRVPGRPSPSPDGDARFHVTQHIVRFNRPAHNSLAKFEVSLFG